MSKVYLPYGRHEVTEDDIAAVVEVLRSDALTQGPVVQRFEKAVAEYCGARHAVAVANGTAALHIAALAAGFQTGDEVVTSPNTFVASANCIAYAGGRPVFADIDTRSYCITAETVAKVLTKETRGIIPVHFAGQPCDMAAISRIAGDRSLLVIEDAAHAIGARYIVDGKSYTVGCCAHSAMTIFSFHPVKHITTGEGGVITTNSDELYNRLLLFRTHGITRNPDLLTRTEEGAWYYEQQALGFNYRITDIQCALGLSQLKRLDSLVERRRRIAAIYDNAFSDNPHLTVPFQRPDAFSAWHLYVLCTTLPRRQLFDFLRERGIGVNVHYIPVHMQPFFQKTFGYAAGDYPNAERYYQQAVTLPLFPGMTDDDVEFVVTTVFDAVKELI